MIRLEYVGHIPELQGKLAVTRELVDADRREWLVNIDHLDPVMAQFDDPVSVNHKRMNVDWHPIPRAHFIKPRQDGKTIF